MENKKCYNVKDLEEILDCSRPTVYELLKTGAFVVHKIGKNYRIPKESFDQWLMKESK